MDIELQRLIREYYPFPIAHAHKKTLAELDDNVQKLKCLIQTAEVTIQLLALVMLAQLHRDLEHQQAPALGTRGLHLRDDLRNPSLGKWHGILRDVLKAYRDHRDLLVVPELFVCFFQPSRSTKLAAQPLVRQAIEPLITLRNRFHHEELGTDLPNMIATGSRWLEQFLASLQFMQHYDLAYVERIEVHHQDGTHRRFSHDLLQMDGCFSVFGRQRWESERDLRARRMVLLTSHTTGQSLFLDPFIIYADQLPVSGVYDVFLLNGTEQRQARYHSMQFGQELRTDTPAWPEGEAQMVALGQFYDLLRHAPITSTEVEVEGDDQTRPEAEERGGGSTEDVFMRRYKRQETARRHVSPYKFLHYFEPEDADLFFGRDQEIRLLQRKFHAARLLILHGESGTGKTSLIRAGLLPRLSAESYVPVYVRAIQEPTRAIKAAMIHQLGVDDRHVALPLAQFLDTETMHLSKTVVVILDQFEEFFLRFPLDVRQQFHHELGACVTADHLDVHFIISLRDDYFGALNEFEAAIPEIFTHQMFLTRLTSAQALAAAVELVKALELSIDESLMAQVILPQLDEAEQGIAPPLLQIVCDGLYHHAQEAGKTHIGEEEYAALGDVRDVLGHYLDATLRQFGATQPQARAVLKALVTAEGTKRASFVEELVARVQTTGMALTAEVIERDILRRLMQARLVRVEDVVGQPRYELAHEFLVSTIGAWIAESERELTKVLELIDRAYEAYQATGLLLEPGALALIAPFADELVLPTDKQRFLDLSRQTARRQRRGLWMKVGVALLVVALGIGGVAGWQLYQSYQRLQATNVQLQRQTEAVAKQSQVAEERARQVRQQLTAHYIEQGRQELLGGNALRALPYLSEAYQLGETGPILRFLLAQAMRPLDAQLVSPYGHTDGVWNAGFSPDGTRLVTVGVMDRGAKVWDATTGQLYTSLEGHTDRVDFAEFSPDGTRLVTASSKMLMGVGAGIVQVWDVALETRSPAEIAALVRCKAPWRLEAGRLLPATLDPTACPPRSAAR